MARIDELRQQLTTMAKHGAVISLLGWDQEVNLPPKGQAFRGEVAALLASDLHQRVTDSKFVKLVKQLNQPTAIKRLSRAERVIVRETWRDLEKATKLPSAFVEELTRLTARAYGVWVDARQSSDFSHFAPVLTKIVELVRRQAELLGYQDSPYDALLDLYEPDMTVAQLDGLFEPLARELADLIRQAKKIKPYRLPAGDYPLDKQSRLNELVAGRLGYDLRAGRIDTSPHPFMTSFHPTDARLTTRYDHRDFWISLGSVIHEIGHALYEQGLPAAEFGTPLGEAISLGIHESQSRLWENFVGRSRPFAEFLQPEIKAVFGARKVRFTTAQLHRSLNFVRPSLIRVEADEVTYNLHIVIRYELEKDLIEGRLKVKDLPAVWHQKYKDYLGVRVPDDARGVLQDIHWSHGSFGYFPTYALGNLYAAQLYAAAKRQLPRLEIGFARGNFAPLLDWLHRNIHRHGRRYHPTELIKRATGQSPSPDYLVEHLKRKLGG